MGSTEEAIKLLKETSWFHNASTSFLETLAAKMKLVEAEDGYIFVDEGLFMEHIIILEEGVLARTKMSIDEDGEKEKMQSSFHSMSLEKVSSSIEDNSVLVDTIQGRARVTGLLHNIKKGSEAYATVSAKGSVKAWLISGEDFREALKSKPEYAMEVIYAMSQELRVGSKSLRGLIKKVKGSGSADEDSNGTVCRVLCYDSTSWVTDGFKPAVEAFNASGGESGYTIEMDYTTERLSEQSATYAAGYDAVCLFVNDTANADVLQTLSLLGVRMVAMRCAGFDRVDMKAARAYGMTVARVPAYSPYAVAEMGIALLMSLNRKINKASNRVKMANFTLDAGLMGMDIFGKTVGVMGTGKIGQILCNIILGFGAKLICYDVFESDDVKKAGGVYVTKEEIFKQSDVIFLMMPLIPPTHHTINESVLPMLKKGVLLINTSRGGLVDTKALLKGLQTGVIGGVGMDVYENESKYFFQDWSAKHIDDPDLVALLGQNNVVLTAHQAFFTQEAIDKIVSTTLENVREFQKGLTGQKHPNNCIPALKE